MICKKCGTENADNASVCAKCGNPLKAVSKPKSNFLDVSFCSGLIIVFSVLALIFLILPSTRSVSYSEYEGKMVKLDEKKANEVIDIVRDKITIRNERDKIDNLPAKKAALEAEIAELEENSDGSDDAKAEIDRKKKQVENLLNDAVWKQTWTAAEAIEILEGIPGNDAYIAEIKRLDEIVKTTTDAANVKAQEEIENYILEVMDKQDDDRIDRGAIGGVIREHREMKNVTNTLIAVMCVLLAVSLFITIISWVTRMYRVRIIATIANAVLAFLSFVIPVAVWSMDTKWPFEVSQYITYGISFGSTFVWVLVFSFATLFASLAYFADDLFAKKN